MIISNFQCVSCVFPDMAYLCTSGRPVRPVPKGHFGRYKLVITGLHGGGYSAQLWHYLDAGHPWAPDLGTKTFNDDVCVVFVYFVFVSFVI